MSVPFVRHSGTAYRALWGDDALDGLPGELDRLSARRVVVICGRSVAASEVFRQVLLPMLGERCAGMFAEVKPHSPIESVEAAARLLQDVEADAVVAVGGGSAVVTARAATILAAERAPVRELATHRAADGRMVSPRLSAAKIPNIVVATTPTTAYAKAGAAVRDTASGDRLALFDPKSRAAATIFDGRFAATAPKSLVVSAGLNVLSMAVDGLQGSGDDPLTVAMLGQALRESVGALPLIADDADRHARVRLMLAALMAGMGSDSAGTGLAQGLSHALGPISQTANGVIEALLLPHTARFNLGTTDAGLRIVGDILERSSAEPQNVPLALERLLERLGTPTRLRDVGLRRRDLPGVIEHSLADWAITRVPKRASVEDLARILDRAW